MGKSTPTELIEALSDNGLDDIESIQEHFESGGELPSAIKAYLETMVPEYRDTVRVVAEALSKGYSIRNAGDNQVYDITLQRPTETLDLYHDAQEAVMMQRLAVGYNVRVPGIGIIGLQTNNLGEVIGRFQKNPASLGKRQKLYGANELSEDTRITFGGMRQAGVDNAHLVSPVDETIEDWTMFVQAVQRSLLPVAKNVFANASGMRLKRLGLVKHNKAGYVEFEPSEELANLYTHYHTAAPPEMHV